LSNALGKGSYGYAKNDILICTSKPAVVNVRLMYIRNHLSGVMSPIIVKDWPCLGELRRLAALNYSKRAYHSIKGLAEHNYEKYIVNERDDSVKRCNTIARTILMGCKLLREGIIEYISITGTSPKDIPKFIDELDLALKESTLPDAPQHENEIRDFLIDVRLSSLEEEQE